MSTNMSEVQEWHKHLDGEEVDMVSDLLSLPCLPEAECCLLLVHGMLLVCGLPPFTKAVVAPNIESESTVPFLGILFLPNYTAVSP